jgi:hypothetical protein
LTFGLLCENPEKPQQAKAGVFGLDIRKSLTELGFVDFLEFTDRLLAQPHRLTVQDWMGSERQVSLLAKATMNTLLGKPDEKRYQTASRGWGRCPRGTVGQTSGRGEGGGAKSAPRAIFFDLV